MDTHEWILGVPRNGPARRSLFGPVDREQLRVESQAALRRDLEEASRRWGFDFISDKPLASGEFQWERVPGSEVPLLYRSCVFGLGQKRRRPTEATPEATPTAKRGRMEQSERENTTASPERRELNAENLEKTPERRESSGAKRKQTNLTDFYQTKRRVVWMPRKSGE